MCPVDGGRNLCCVHGKILVLQETLESPKIPRHTRQLPLLWAELRWGRRFGQKMSTKMGVGDSTRNHLGLSLEPPPHLPTHLKRVDVVVLHLLTFSKERKTSTEVIFLRKAVINQSGTKFEY